MAESSRIEELRRRVQMDPASIAFAALAEEYRRAGRHDEAIAACVEGLKRHPAYVSARVTLGRALLETGRFEEARAELEHVLRVAPENLAAIRGLAEIHHRVGAAPEGTAAEPEETAPPAPIRLVPLSTDPPAEPPALPEKAETGSVDVQPVPAPAAHPDLAALPALEALLRAILRERSDTTDETRAAAARVPVGHL